MSFLEVWGETNDPGPRGSIKWGGNHDPCRWTLLVWARVVFLLVALPIVWTVAAANLTGFSFWEGLGLVVGGTCLYVGLAFFVRPEPNLDNIGVCGGLVDHPGRWSDDWNRHLFGLQVLLGPGRFIAESLADFALLFQGEGAEEDAGGTLKDDGQMSGEHLPLVEERRFQVEE